MLHSFSDPGHYERHRWREVTGGPELSYELLDEDVKIVAQVTRESLVADWQANG